MAEVWPFETMTWTLRGQVLLCAHERVGPAGGLLVGPDLRLALAARLVVQAEVGLGLERQVEVGHLDVPGLGEQQVLGLHVPVDDPVQVHALQGVSIQQCAGGTTARWPKCSA